MADTGPSNDQTPAPAAHLRAIRESERLYTAIGGNAPIIIWMDDAEGRCIYLNRAWRELTGLTEADGLGNGWFSVVHPDDCPALQAEFRAAIGARAPFRSEYRMRRHDGTWRWVIDSATPVFNEGGEFQGHLGSVLDITERKQAEAALQKNEEMFRLAAEATALGLWDYDIASGALTWNARLKELYGLPPDANVTYEIYHQGLHPEERERVTAAYQAALDSSGTGRFGFEHRTVAPDGAVRWVQAAGRVIFDEQSRPVRALGTVRDITERKQSEQALRASEARYRRVVETSLQGIWVHRDGRIIYANAQAARMFGAARADYLIGKPVIELAHPDERPRAAERTRHLIESVESVPLTEMKYLGAGGQTLLLEVQAVSFQDEIGTAILAVGRDITQQKAAQERQSFLMAELDHRVRNILASVQSMVSLTGRTVATKQEYEEKLKGRIGAMSRVHDLLTRRHWDGADVADIIRSGLQAHGDAIRLSGSSGYLLRARDALNLALVVHELATNATKYGALSAAGGQVEVAWTLRGGDDERRIHIVWQERGGPDVKPPTRAGFGSRIIQGTLPKVRLDFDPAGVRCEIVLMPRLFGRTDRDTSDAAEVRSLSATQPMDGALPGLRVLIVEDDALTALELQSELERSGAQVVGVANSLHEALALADREVDVALLDINLNDEMSFPAAEVLVARGVPVAFATGYEASQMLPPHLRNLPVFRKPVDLDSLVQYLAMRRTTGAQTSEG